MPDQELRETPDHPSNALLVETFFAEAVEAFRPIVMGPGSTWTSQLRQSTARGLEPATLDRLESVFFAECEFQAANLDGKITFGDRELHINTLVRPNGLPCRYALWEWADALDRPELVPRATQFVFQVPRLQQIVRGMANALQELGPAIAAAAPATLKRIEAARASVAAAIGEEHRQAERRYAVARANEAFRQQRWERVVELLQLVEDRLSPAEAKKLAHARKRAR